MIWMTPVAAPPTETSRRLRDLLGAHAEEYERGARAIAECWPAMQSDDVLTLKRLRAQSVALAKAVANLLELIDPEADAVPFMVREALFTHHGEPDPRAFLSDLHARLMTLRDVEAIVARQLPAPRKGNPGRARKAGADWMRQQLFMLYERVTGKPGTSSKAAECAGIVLEWLGGPTTDADNLQKQAARLKKKSSP